MGCANPKDLSCQHHAPALPPVQIGGGASLIRMPFMQKSPQAQQSTDQPTRESSFIQENLWPTLIK